uniref:Secreted protein n=1 Tax=Panagrellus redivivus TaxID=6233 RepID=A0A7E5A0P3_PANRE
MRSCLQDPSYRLLVRSLDVVCLGSTPLQWRAAIATTTMMMMAADARSHNLVGTRVLLRPAVNKRWQVNVTDDVACAPVARRRAIDKCIKLRDPGEMRNDAPTKFAVDKDMTLFSTSLDVKPQSCSFTFFMLLYTQF